MSIHPEPDKKPTKISLQIINDVSPKPAGAVNDPMTSRSTSQSSLGRFCRICHESDEPLILACKCRGSVGYTHERCLVEWLSRCGKATCELCGTAYILRVKHSNRWSGLLASRISKHDKAMILVNVICLLFLISTTAWLVWSAFSPENVNQRNNELYQTCYALYGFMDIFCLGILIHEIPHMHLLWRRLRLLRYELYVLPYGGSLTTSLSRISQIGPTSLTKIKLTSDNQLDAYLEDGSISSVSSSSLERVTTTMTSSPYYRPPNPFPTRTR